MMCGNCKICDYQDDCDYLHPIYDGHSPKFVMICETCRNKIFSDHERSKREDTVKMAFYKEDHWPCDCSTGMQCLKHGKKDLPNFNDENQLKEPLNE